MRNATTTRRVALRRRWFLRTIGWLCWISIKWSDIRTVYLTCVGSALADVFRVVSDDWQQRVPENIVTHD